jgi:hypothetical protein
VDNSFKMTLTPFITDPFYYIYVLLIAVGG